MSVHPVFYTKSDFLNIPDGSKEEVDAYLYEMSRSRYVQNFEAKAIAKSSHIIGQIDNSVGRIVDSDLLSEFVVRRNELNDALTDFSNAKMFADNIKRDSPELRVLVDKLQSIHDLARDTADYPDDSYRYNDIQELDKVAYLANKVYVFVAELPKDLTLLGSFPKTCQFDPVSLVDSTSTMSGDVNASYKSARIGDVLVSLKLSETRGDMGSREIKEEWQVNGKPLRAGKLPSEVTVYYDPSAEDLSPSFKMSSGIAMIEDEYKDMYEQYVSRSLACDYIGSNSEEYQNSMRLVVKEREEAIGKALVEINSPKGAELENSM
jgi:hypothetical protein